jgi:hypothetical protein
VNKKIAEAPAIRQKIFHAAMKVSREYHSRLELGQPVGGFLKFKHGLADKIVFKNIREKLGGKLRSSRAHLNCNKINKEYICIFFVFFSIQIHGCWWCCS